MSDAHEPLRKFPVLGVTNFPNLGSVSISQNGLGHIWPTRAESSRRCIDMYKCASSLGAYCKCVITLSITFMHPSTAVSNHELGN